MCPATSPSHSDMNQHCQVSNDLISFAHRAVLNTKVSSFVALYSMHISAMECLVYNKSSRICKKNPSMLTWTWVMPNLVDSEKSYCQVPSCDPTGWQKSMFGVPRVAYGSNEYCIMQRNWTLLDWKPLCVRNWSDQYLRDSAGSYQNVKEKWQDTFLRWVISIN